MHPIRSSLAAGAVALSALTAGPAAGSTPPVARPVARPGPLQEIAWFDGPFLNALGRANAQGNWLFVYFWMPESQHCDRLWKDTLDQPAAAQALDDFVCYSVDATAARGARLLQRYGVTTLPTLLFLDPEGAPEDAIQGYIPPAAFGPEVARIEAGFETVSDLRQRCAAAPEDLDLRYRLATKLDFVGARSESDALIESIRRDDPEGRTEVGARLALYAVMNEVLARASDANDPSTYDLSALYAHTPRIGPALVQLEAWQWLADVEGQRGNRERARAARAAAWRIVPERGRLEWGHRLALSAFEERRELGREERAFALEVAQEVVALAEALLADPEAPSLADLEIETEFEGELTGLLARELDLLARCYFMNGKRRAALAAVERSIELDPGVPEHQALREFLESEQP